MSKLPADADILPPSDDHIFKTLLTHPDAECVLADVISAAIERTNDTLNKPVDELTQLEMWSLFFRFAPDPKRRDLVNEIIETKKEVDMAAKLLQEISQDERERARARSRRMFETGMTSNLLTAERRGRIEGEKRVLALLEQGASPDEIRKKLGI